MGSILLFLLISISIPLSIMASKREHVAMGAARRRERLLEAGDMETWLRGMGLRVVPSGRDSDSTRAVGMVGELTVLIGCTSFSEFDAKTTFEVRLDLSLWIDPSLSVHGGWVESNGVPVYEGEMLVAWVGRDAAGDVFRYEGERVAAMALAGSSFGRHLLDLYLRAEFGVRAFTFEGGVLRLVHGSMLRIIEEGGDDVMRNLLGVLEALRRDMHSRPSDAEELAAYVRSDRDAAARLDAVGLLKAYRSDSAAAHALAEDLDTLDTVGRAVCLLRGREGIFARPPRERVAALQAFAFNYPFSDEVVSVLQSELAWHTLLNSDVASSVRMAASERAFGAPDAPDDAATRDEDLVGLFTSTRNGRKLSVSLVFRRLVGAGWVPGPDAAFALARDGERVVREELVAWLGRRSDVEAYRGTLAVLEKEGVPGASKLASTLAPRPMDGRLSLVEGDTTRGGLSQAAEAGGLSSADD